MTETAHIAKMPNKRVYFADIARGLAVIYFIWCHTVNIHVDWIDTWAMPVFFVVMGIFFKPTNTWREMLVKKTNTILVPFFLLSIPSFIQYAITLPLKDYLWKIAYPFKCVHGVGWFLICIFWCYIFYYGINRLVSYKKKYVLLVCFIISILSFYSGKIVVFGHFHLGFPYFISTAMTVLPLIAIGDICRNLLKQERNWMYNLGASAVLLISTMGGALLLNFKGGEYISNYFYEQAYWVVIPISLLGTASILYISKLLPTWMSYAGEHSLLLLMIHPYVMRMVKLFIAQPLILFCITLVFSLIFIGILSYYMPVLEGKKNIIK